MIFGNRLLNLDRENYPLLQQSNILIFKSELSEAKAHIEELGYGTNFSSYPYFEFNVPRNVTTTVGQTAFLHCRVEQLGDKARESEIATKHIRDACPNPFLCFYIAAGLPFNLIRPLGLNHEPTVVSPTKRKIKRLT
ncbi:hypothetical protein FQA39_LY13207 [Lamprigera yunnana]|nr:hypothetical protein FQA39_LY13207 [Lamprigera yunnana]